MYCILDDEEEEEKGEEEGRKRSILQAKLTNLAVQIGYVGMTVALATVIVLAIEFSVYEFYLAVSF